MQSIIDLMLVIARCPLVDDLTRLQAGAIADDLKNRSCGASLGSTFDDIFGAEP